MAVCIGPEFTTGTNGELLLQGPQHQAWPYTGCPLEDSSPLRIDPVMGLWSPPQRTWRTTSTWQRDYAQPLPSAARFRMSPPDITFTNTSSCMPALVDGTEQFHMNISLIPGCDVEVTGGLYPAAEGEPGPNTFTGIWSGNAPATGQASFGTATLVTLPFQIIVPPGGIFVMRRRYLAIDWSGKQSNLSLVVTETMAKMQIIDPADAGGPSFVSMLRRA